MIKYLAHFFIVMLISTFIYFAIETTGINRFACIITVVNTVIFILFTND